MKKLMITIAMTLVLSALAACSDSTAAKNSEATTSPNSSLEANLVSTAEDSITQESVATEEITAEEVTIEEVSGRAVEYYPEEVSFQYVRQDKITDEANQDGYVNQECYIFDVLYEGNKVSGVAVGVEDGSIWIEDMNSDYLWLSESFMGLSQSVDGEDAELEPIAEISSQNSNNNEVYMYFARIDTIPEFSKLNEGSATWNEGELTLNFVVTKATGTITGAVDGPSVNAVVTWKDGVPEVISVDYSNAPTYSQPSQVLLSRETINIETDRMIEIAECFRDLIQEKLDEID